MLLNKLPIEVSVGLVLQLFTLLIATNALPLAILIAGGTMMLLIKPYVFAREDRGNF